MTTPPEPRPSRRGPSDPEAVEAYKQWLNELRRLTRHIDALEAMVSITNESVSAHRTREWRSAKAVELFGKMADALKGLAETASSEAFMLREALDASYAALPTAAELSRGYTPRRRR